MSNQSLPNFEKGINGLLPVIAQDSVNGRVLMFAWMNRQAFDETVKSKVATYYSRSRQSFWKKGETSGHVQHVVRIEIDCDADCILLHVEQVGAACHEGYRSCFFRTLQADEFAISESQVVDPNSVYKS